MIVSEEMKHAVNDQVSQMIIEFFPLFRGFALNAFIGEGYASQNAHVAAGLVVLKHVAVLLIVVDAVVDGIRRKRQHIRCFVKPSVGFIQHLQFVIVRKQKTYLHIVVIQF
jgi:hypothetical protein